MKVGTVLSIEVDRGIKDPIYCRSRVIKVNHQSILIDLPSNVYTKKTVYLTKGDQLLVSFVGEDEAVYQFYTEVQGRKDLNVPAFGLAYPDQVDRIQRRRFVRINVAVDVAVHCPQLTFRPFTTVSRDISGGGLSFIAFNGIELDKGQGIDLWIAIQMDTGEFHYLDVEAEVIEIRKETKKQIVSVEYSTLSEEHRRRIIHYCFEKQRELKKKERI